MTLENASRAAALVERLRQAAEALISLIACVCRAGRARVGYS